MHFCTHGAFNPFRIMIFMKLRSLVSAGFCTTKCSLFISNMNLTKSLTMLQKTDISLTLLKIYVGCNHSNVIFLLTKTLYINNHIVWRPKKIILTVLVYVTSFLMILLEKNLPKQIMIKHTFRISSNTHPRPELISFLHARFSS